MGGSHAKIIDLPPPPDDPANRGYAGQSQRLTRIAKVALYVRIGLNLCGKIITFFKILNFLLVIHPRSAKTRFVKILSTVAFLTALMALSIVAHAASEMDHPSGTTGDNSEAFAGDIQANLLRGIAPVATAASDVGGFPPSSSTNGNSGASFLDNGAFGGNQLPGASFTFTLNTSAAPLGFTLTEIQTIAGGLNVGDQSFADQAYTVSYSTVAAPTVFIPLSTVNYAPFAVTSTGSPNPTSSEVNLTNLSGAIGVDALQFTFAVANEGGNTQDGGLMSGSKPSVRRPWRCRSPRLTR
jgi:hypothetical protein